MTPMIDIVFQLLIFFIMTFKIVSQEGDFNIHMPLAAIETGPPQDPLPPPIKIRLAAVSDADARANNLKKGELAYVMLNDTRYDARYVPVEEIGEDDKKYTINVVDTDSTFRELHSRIINLIGTSTGPGSFQEDIEVELDCDYNLRYERVINAITQVSGFIDPNTGDVVKLIEKIKFSPPRGPPADEATP